MNTDKNQFEPLTDDDKNLERLQKIFKTATTGVPEEEKAPTDDFPDDQILKYELGELVPIKGYWFRISAISKDEIRLKPHGPTKSLQKEGKHHES